MIGGEGVYKARSLWSYFNPLADYDDNLICASYGLNKQTGIVTKPIVKEYFKLYPNPAYDKLTIEYNLNNNDHAQILIYDLVGKLVLKQELFTGQKNIKLDVSKIAKGNYIVKYMKNDQNIEQYKISLQ